MSKLMASGMTRLLAVAALSVGSVLGITVPALATDSAGTAATVLAVPGAAVSKPSVVGEPAAARTGVDDFVFDSFTADYYLGVDDDGRSTLTTVEKFVAVFPESDQNRGMRRAIPLDYQGAPTDLDVQSVTDASGAERPFETESDDDGFLIVTSAGKSYVHGEQTYVFTYTQHNVTRYFPDERSDQFYWDTVGTGADQPYGSVTARLHVPAGIVSALTGEAACYQGPEGSTRTCDIGRSDESDGAVFTATASDLAPRENVTVAVAFVAGTFVARDSSYFGSPAAWVQLVAVIAALLIAIWALVLRRTVFADGAGRPTIIAEYTPPRGLDPFVAASILAKTGQASAAAFLDLAVRRRVRILAAPKTGFLASGEQYSLQLLDATGVADSELELLRAMFTAGLDTGAIYTLKSGDTALSKRVRTLTTQAAATSKNSGLRKSGTGRRAVLPIALAIAALAASVICGAILLEDARGGAIPGLLMIPGLLGLFFVFGCVIRTPLTSAGAQLRDHLKGLEVYIRLAEADRLRMLQSPHGALRTPADDGREALELWEKLLPYAVMFGLGKEWATQLSRFYADESPDWYAGQGAFNAGLFAASIGSIASTAATSYSGSSTSSSTGGAGGGGFSGGGGGGGGAGGA